MEGIAARFPTLQGRDLFEPEVGKVGSAKRALARRDRNLIRAKARKHKGNQLTHREA